jgi:hypothetical protein
MEQTIVGIYDAIPDNAKPYVMLALLLVVTLVHGLAAFGVPTKGAARHVGKALNIIAGNYGKTPNKADGDDDDEPSLAGVRRPRR